MKSNYILNVFARDLNETSASDLRKDKKIPVEFYADGKENKHGFVNYEEFRKVFIEAGSNMLVDLHFDDGEKSKVLIHDVQINPVKDTYIHADFYGVKMKEKITTEIPLEIIGISPAIKNLGGMLIQQIDEVEVKCLPGDLVSEIQVDISGLENLGDMIRIEDIVVPEGIEILNEKEDPVLIIEAPHEEEVEEATTEVNVADIPTTSQKVEGEATSEEAKSSQSEKE